MDKGLELTSDGYVLHPQGSAYWIAALVGLMAAIIGLSITPFPSWAVRTGAEPADHT